MMHPDEFYPNLKAIMALPPQERHPQLSALHTQALNRYVNRLNTMTEEEALRPVTVGDDHRTVLQIVGHIAEWERFIILSAADMLIGLERPRLMKSLDGYIALDGSTPTFATIDEFNAYFAEQQKSWTWDKMRPFAIETTTTIHQMFTNPVLLNAERLERTVMGRKWLGTGEVIADIAVGWVLWLIVLEHIATEHVVELGLV
ncbi:MAG: hypothetical protein MUE54_05350 [Anaerolineae bacterium]|jgi:hypothetical protein|nr:hypothetical protein [Anaerolineae bacterium]